MAIIIIIRRIKAAGIKFIQSRCREKFREFLTIWLYDEHANSIPDSIKSRFQNEIQREVFVEELLSLHSNLIGESADILVDLFLLADLKKYSMQKIHDKRWYIQAKGFRELSQMKISEGAELIKPYLNSKNVILRVEAQMAYIQLHPDDPLDFFDDEDLKLTLWSQLNSLVALKKVGKIPDMKRWIMSANKGVALNAIKLTGLYKQYENSELVWERIIETDEDIRKEVIITLGKMAVPFSVPELRELYEIENLTNRTEIINSLTSIFDFSNLDFFEDILLNGRNEYLRILSAKGLKSLDGDGKARLETILSQHTDDEILRSIIMHAQDPRI